MPEPLKNQYSEDYIQRLAQALHQHYPALDTQGFVAHVLDAEWPSKELKQRMRHIVHAIHHFLPVDYAHQLAILQKVAPSFGSFTGMLFPDFVEVYGLEHPELSIPALEYLTQFSSSEFAVRPFIVKYPERMIPQHLAWAAHANHHVRRLATEGIRPRLPWAMALPDFKKNPAPILPILEKLKRDESEYVRRSVANNLNDISKDHPKLLMEIAQKWKGQSPETDWIVRHACRGLLRKGDEQILNIFGFESTQASIKNLALSANRLKIGEEISFHFSVHSEADSEKLKLAYRIDFVKKNGKTSGKVFHLSELEIGKGKTISISKKHAFKDLTTRTHYAGKHSLMILMNGKTMAKSDFELV